MNRALRVLSIVTLVLISSSTFGAEGSDSTWNRYLTTQFREESGYAIAVNSCGNTPCITGYTSALDFPTTAGAYDSTWDYGGDVFISMFNSTANTLIYSTLLGGEWDDYGYSIVLDDSGFVYVTGETASSDFPTTPHAFDSIYSRWEGYITKLNRTGSALIYSTFLGGNKGDKCNDIFIDDSGCACVAGRTSSPDFPTTSGAFDTSFHALDDAFVVKISPTGRDLLYGTFLGGDLREESYGVVVDHEGNIFLAGYTESINFPISAGPLDSTHNGNDDVFIVKLNPFENSLLYSTFLGGGQDDICFDMTIDRFGNVYVVGRTNSEDFPTTSGVLDDTGNGSQDVFVSKLSATGKELVFSTFLGGSSNDIGQSICIDPGGYVYVTGSTYSTNFPTSQTSFDTTYGHAGDAFISKLTPSARNLCYSTFLGGSAGYQESGFGIDLDQYNNAYITGYTDSYDFPITPGVFDNTFNGGEGDVFVTKLNTSGAELIFSTYIGGENPYVGVSESATTNKPISFALDQNYPNPFNAATEIRYLLHEDVDVSLRVYNVAGQTVRSLVDTRQPAGEYAVAWDGSDDAHRAAASGIYFCRLLAGEAAETIKMALVR